MTPSTRLRSSLVIASVCLLVTATETLAQQRPGRRPHFVSSTPKNTEIALIAGLWSLDQWGPTGPGVRVTVNRMPWLAVEASVDGHRQDADNPAETIGTVGVRFSGVDLNVQRMFFVTAGLATGVHLNRKVAPMIGAGIQSLWFDDFVALRGELQYFAGSPIRRTNHARLMLAAVIGF